MSRNTFKKHVDLLLLQEKGKSYYFLIKNFNTSVYDDTLHRRRKNFCCYCLQAFSTDEILKLNIAIKLIVNKGLGYLKKVNMLDSNITRGNKITICVLCRF